MDYIVRNTSILTGKANLEPLYTYKDFPVFFGCVDTDPSEDLCADMSWAICPESGIIQIDKLLPLDILYQAQHMDGTGATWEAFYKDFARYIAEQHPQKILEIGGAHGYLAEAFIHNTQGTEWTIIEPNPLHPGSDRIKIITGFFDENFHSEESFDAVVFSHTLEHAYDPNAFLKTIADALKPGEKLIFAYPQLDVWLGKKYMSALNFEHNFLLTPYFVDYLLVKYGFRIIEKHAYQDHSIYYTAEKLSAPDPLPAYDNKYAEYKKLFSDFIDYYRSIVRDFNEKIHGFEGEVYFFGAHIFSQYLAEVGLDTSKIMAILDNSKLKQGKRLYGTHLEVKSPEHLRERAKVAVVLKVGPYRDEIYKQLMKINPSIVIFE